MMHPVHGRAEDVDVLVRHVRQVASDIIAEQLTEEQRRFDEAERQRKYEEARLAWHR